MKTAIIITTPDYAGLNIKNNLLNDYNFEKTGKKWESFNVWELKENPNIRIYTIDKKCTICENIDKEIEADLFLFPTTHRSAANTNSLSCHTQGNWGPADLGGKPNDLSISPAILLKQIFQNLRKHSEEIEEQITLECTHHGPELNTPTIFIEIGSDENQWKRPELGKIVADVIMNSIKSEPKQLKTAIGIGGPHYCNNFNDIQENSEIAIGHICPKYMLENLSQTMIEQAIEKTTPKPNLVILDWKGIGSEKQRIITTLEELGIEWKKSKELK